MVNVTIDPHGLAIKGAPVIVQAGALHYFRLPHLDLWHSVLVRMRMAGLNAVLAFPLGVSQPGAGEAMNS